MHFRPGRRAIMLQDHPDVPECPRGTEVRLVKKDAKNVWIVEFALPREIYFGTRIVRFSEWRTIRAHSAWLKSPTQAATSVLLA